MSLLRQPIPEYFGESASVFGWIHFPEPSVDKHVGIVVCSPMGYEMMCTHHHLRTWAEQLTSLGYTVVRFDYHGTGDSSGDDRFPNRVETWKKNIAEAIELVKKQGVSKVVVCGLRFGSTLAAAVCHDRADVDAMIALAPISSGRLWVRELKALSSFGSYGGKTEDTVRDYREVAGLWIGSQTLSDAEEIEISKKYIPKIKRACVVHRDDIPDDRRLENAWKQQGILADTLRFTSYADFMRDAHFSKYPTAAFSAVEEWLQKHFPGAERSTNSYSYVDQVSESEAYRESPIYFGNSDRRLFGILTQPRHVSSDARPTLVWLNTAGNHHVGANRMAVDISRHLAEQGQKSFRFDLTGHGDSEGISPRMDSAGYGTSACEDIKIALDHLSAEGSKEFVLVGLCSGAFVSLSAALAEDRVKGLFLVNAQKFTWTEGDSLEIAQRRSFKSTWFYRKALMNPETWVRFFRGKINIVGIAGNFVRLSVRQLQQNFTDSLVARYFDQLLQRGVAVHLIYSGEDGGRDEVDLHLGKDGRKFRKNLGFSLHIIKGADHTLTSLRDRQQLQQLMTQALAVFSSVKK